MSAKNTTKAPSAQVNDAAVVQAIDRLAEQVRDNIESFGLNGGRAGKAKGLIEKVLAAKPTSEKFKAADELAALLKNGTDAAKKVATEITDQLQTKLQLDGKATPPAKGTIPGAVPNVNKGAGAASSVVPKPTPSSSPDPAEEEEPDEGANEDEVTPEEQQDADPVPDDEEGDSDGSGEEDESDDQPDEPGEPDEREGQDDAEQGDQSPAAESPYEEADLRPVKVADIQTAEPFKSLFPALVDKIAKLAADMKARGYDQAHPVVIWEEKKILLDGHCRVRAAGDAGIEMIPAVFQSFGSEDAAFQYAVRTQCARRNLTDGDILSLVQQIDKRYPCGGSRRGRPKEDSDAPSGAYGRSSKETGAKIGYSYRTIDRVRKLIKSNNASLLQEVANGTLSLGEALKRLPKGHRTVDPEKAADRARRKVQRLLESAKEVIGTNEALFPDMSEKLDGLLNELEA